VKHWTPRPYQVRAVQHLIDNAGAGLCLHPGLGKTSCTLAGLELFRDHKIAPALIVAPLRVCYSVWPKEVEKWGADLKVAILHGSKKLQALDSGADVFLINPEGLRWLAVQHLRPQFQIIVLDESTKFKNAKSQRYKALEGMLDPRVKRVIILTGTPAANNLQDIWAQVKLLDGGERLGKFITHFRKKFFTSNLIRIGGGRTVEEWVPTPETSSKIAAAISDICLFMSAEDHLQMPPLLYNTIEVELPADAWDVYKTLERDLVADLGRDTLSAAHAAVVVNKLRQIVGGQVYADESTQTLHAEKLDALIDLVEEQAGQPLLVAVAFQHEAEAIARAIKREFSIDVPYLGGGISAKKSDEIASRWNRGELPVLLAHPASVAHGLNLQAGGHAVCWYTLTWSLEEYDQLNRRVYRQGQTQTVIVHHIVAKDTVDARVVEVLQGKDRTQRGLLNLLKETLK
jgi:SNF2 family DNA or RNA helicase